MTVTRPAAPKVNLELADDQMCFGCGNRNPRGLKLHFTIDPERRSIRTRWTPTKEFQGYADIVHGGMVGLVLDEMMVNLLWKLKLPAVTAELTVRFLKPTRVGESIDCQAHVKSEQGKLFLMEGKAKNSDGGLVAAAFAKCVRV